LAGEEVCDERKATLMYLLPNCTDARGYFPINTKWGGTSTLSGLLPGGGLRGLPERTWARVQYGSQSHSPGGGLHYFERPAPLAYFRPNFAMSRGNYPGNQYVGAPSLGWLGQQTKDVSVMADKWFLSGMGRRMGQLAVDPSLLAAGVGTLAVGMFLLGRKHPRRRKRRRAR
jgi:hypothetical protein